jgi:hypothetical protein
VSGTHEKHEALIRRCADNVRARLVSCAVALLATHARRAASPSIGTLAR